MKKEEKHTISDNLLINFLFKEIDEIDLMQVNNWLNENDENKEYLVQLENVWKHSESIKDFNLIDTKSDLNLVLKKINSNKNDAKNHKINHKKTFLRIAAVVVILLGVGILLKDFVIKEPYLIASTGDNQQKEIVLDDGSQIKLNSNSKIEYPEKFKRTRREVKLVGEAFFEITKNPEKSFKISTSNSIVEVLGTSFNINSTSNKVIVDVVTGKVAFYNERDKKNKLVLIKGEHGIQYDNLIEKSLNTNSNFLAWNTGILEFRNSKIQDVVSELENYYGINFEIKDNSINDLIITTTIDNQTLENVLEEFKIIFGIEYSISKDTVKLENK